MPSPTPKKNVGGNPLNKIANQSAAEISSAVNVSKKKMHHGQKQTKPNRKNNIVQLFAFDAVEEENNSRGGGRPKRKLKAITRFSTSSFDKAAHCKVGEGFPCPRCSAVCSYDSRACEECGLACSYEAGIGVVVLKERRVSGVEHVRPSNNKHASLEEVASGAAEAATVTDHDGNANATSSSSGTSTMQQVTAQRNIKRQSLPQAKADNQVIQSTRKRQSYPPVAKIGCTHPTDENDTHIVAQPAEGFPDGWVCRKVPRPNGTRPDSYWYSPKKRYKFRSKINAQCFLNKLGQTNGDESAALLLWKASFRGRRKVAAGKALHNQNDSLEKRGVDAKETEETQKEHFAAKETTGTKMRALNNYSLKSAPKENGVSPSERDATTNEIAAAPRQSEEAAATPRNSVILTELSASPPPCRYVQVQLYEDELQADRSESAEAPNKKVSAQKEKGNTALGDHQAESKSSTESAALSTNHGLPQGTNNEIANLLYERETELKEAEATIASLRQKDLLSTNAIQQLSNELSNEVVELGKHSRRVSLLENALHVERLAVQDLERQLGDAENDIVTLTQQNNAIDRLNEDLQSRFAEMTSQKEKQAMHLQGMTNSVQSAIEEKIDISRQLSNLQSKYNSLESDTAESILMLHATIHENEESATACSSQLSHYQNIILEVVVERDELLKELENKNAELSAVQQVISNGSSRAEEVQLEMENINAQRDNSEERVAALQSETDHANQIIAAMKSEKEELVMKLDGVNAQIGALELVNEAHVNKLEAECTEKEKEIVTLKQQASKRMSQVYELTDQLSTALADKSDLEEKADSDTAERSLMREKAETQVANISELEISIVALEAERDAATSQVSKMFDMNGSKAEFIHLETEKAEAVAKSESLSNTVEELQGKIERLSVSLNASKTESSGAPYDMETKYKETIHNLEECVNKQNEEMQELNESVSTSNAQTSDLVAQVSTLATERDELKGMLDKATEKVSHLQSTAGSRVKQCSAEGRKCDRQSDVEHSDEVLSAIISEREALVMKLEECITRFDAAEEESHQLINGIKAKVANMRDQNRFQTNEINSSDEILSQAETLERQLTEEDSEVSELLNDAEKFEARMKKCLRKFKQENLVKTKDCKAKLKQRHKTIHAMKADISKSKPSRKRLARKKEHRSVSSKAEHPHSAVSRTGQMDEGRAEPKNDEENDGILDDVELQDDAEEESVDGPLFAFDEIQEQYNWGRPKRKLKAIARFESMTFDSKKKADCKIGEGFSCPGCSAVCSYDAKECEECHIKCYYEAGIGVVVLKERNVDMERKSQVYHTHPSRQQLKPKKRNQRLRISSKGERMSEETKISFKDQIPSSSAWTQIEHRQVLPGGGKEYPRELPRVIDFIEAQCKRAEENVVSARRTWMADCKKEADAEANAIAVERLVYNRGLRERSRISDKDRLEKSKYNERAKETKIHYEHETGNGMNEEDVEATKLCSQPIVFLEENDTRLVESARTCMVDECQVCRKDYVSRQELSLENEINESNCGAPTSESPLIRKTAQLLNPSFCLINDDHFDHIKNARNTGEASKRRLHAEEDELEKLNHTKHCLNFIKKYNKGFVVHP